MRSDWQVKKMKEFIEFNPTERLAKGCIAKKISMEMLQPFTKDIFRYELQPYNGGAKFQSGDTIMARITPCLENGKISKVNVLDDGEIGFGSTEYIVLRAIPGISDPDYIYYLTTSALVREPAIKSMVGSSGRQRVQQSVLESLELPIPPYEEQKKIAAVLSALDEKIATNRAVNDNLQQQAATIFSTWLNNCSESITIGDLSNNVLDYSPLNKNTVRLLNSSDVSDGIFPVPPLVTNKDLKGHFKKRFKYGDILYSEIRPRNHHYGLVLFDSSDYIASTRLMVIRAKEHKITPAMLYQYLLLPDVEAEFTLKTESRSGTFPQGNYADMASIVVPFASLESQPKIATTLSKIRETIAYNQLENQHLAELRDALLPNLMSGEIDVSDVQL